MMCRLHYILTFLLFSAGMLNPAFAQEKYEKESRIRPEAVPINALQFIESLPVTRKIKWYRETGLNRTSFEAKFKLNGAKYSVEFDTTGVVEDVEIQIPQIPDSLVSQVTMHLEKDCERHKIRRIQVQYTGNRSALITMINSGERDADITVNYELVIKCKNQEGVNLFEYLFDSQGDIISVARIVFQNSSNLEY